METDSLRLLRNRQTELLKELEVIRASMKPVEDELHQVETGIRAMEGAVLKPTGHEASLKAVAHYARVANPEAKRLTMKQLILQALGEHLTHGATANELLDFFATHWGRTEIMRTSLSPQLSRLKEEGKIELRGKVWTLARNENGAPEGAPEAGEAPTSPLEDPDDLLRCLG